MDRRPVRPDPARAAGDPRWLLPLPRLLLLAVPMRRPLREHARQQCGQHRFPNGRGRGAVVIIVVLALLGVPLWLCAVAILILVLRNRGLRTRPGDMPVRVLRPGKKHWARGHAVWVSDVFAWRGSPASWKEELAEVVAVTVRAPESAEHTRLHRL